MTLTTSTACSVPNDAGDGAEHARFLASRDRAGRRRLGEKAAIVRQGFSSRILLIGAKCGEIAVELAERCGHQRLSGEKAGVVHEVARGEIVRTVRDDIVARNDLQRVFRRDSVGHGFDRDMGIQALAQRSRPLGFQRARIRRPIRDLPLQIVDRHAVVVDDADMAGASRREIHEKRRAEPARAHHEHARRLESLLALAANVLHQKVPLVALDFVRR